MSQHLPHLSTTRRTLLRTTAWSVPAVSLAAAAPAFATSGESSDGVAGGRLRVVWGPTEGEQDTFAEFLAVFPVDIHSHQVMTVFEVYNLAESFDEYITIHGAVKPPTGWGAMDHEFIGTMEDDFVPVTPNGTLPEGGELLFLTPKPLRKWIYPASLIIWTPSGSVIPGDTSPWEFKVMPPMNAVWLEAVPMSFSSFVAEFGGGE